MTNQKKLAKILKKIDECLYICEHEGITTGDYHVDSAISFITDRLEHAREQVEFCIEKERTA